MICSSGIFLGLNQSELYEIHSKSFPVRFGASSRLLLLLVERPKVQVTVLPQKLLQPHPLDQLLPENVEDAPARARAAADVATGEGARGATALIAVAVVAVGRLGSIAERGWPAVGADWAGEEAAHGRGGGSGAHGGGAGTEVMGKCALKRKETVLPLGTVISSLLSSLDQPISHSLREVRSCV